MVKHDVLERFYGDKCVNYCALKETIAKFAKACKHMSTTQDLGDFVEKNVGNGGKMLFGQFFWALSSWLFEIP